MDGSAPAAAESGAAGSVTEHTDADGTGRPQPAEPGAAAPRGRRRLSRRARISLIGILCVALIAGAAFAVRYLLDTSRYITTDNAQIDGTQIIITAPASG